MKKFLAVILVLVTLFSVCAPLAGCASFTPMQMGAWLSLIADSFGMVSYTSKQPYFEQVGPSDTYFDAFQLAAEWEILAPDSAVSSGTQVTWKDVLVTLVNAGEFLSVDATEEEKIAFAIANFDPEIRTYWMNRGIKMSEAVPLLDKAAELWANRTYSEEEKIEEFAFGEGVVSLLNEENLDFTADGNVITIDKDKVSGLRPGDVYVLPNSVSGAEGGINRVASIEIDGDKAIITNEPEITIDEATGQVQTIRMRDSAPVDFANVTAIYDAQGNALYSVDSGVNTSLASVTGDEFAGVSVSTLESRGSDRPGIANAGFFDNAKGTLSFKVGDNLKAELNFTSSSVGIKLTGKEKKDSKFRSQTKETSVNVELKDVALTKDVDYSWGKLHSATVKLDYTASVSGGITYKREGNVGKYSEEGDVKSSLSSIVSGFAKTIGDIRKDVYDTKYDNKSIYICRIRLWTAGVASLDFIVQGKVTATGQFQVTVTLSGAKGVEYKNGNMRYISASEPGVNLSGEGTVELTVCPGFELNVLKVVKVNATFDVGVGAKFSAKVYLVDAEWHKLYTGDAVLTEEDANELSQINYSTSAEEILAKAEAEGATWNGYKSGMSVDILPKACIEFAIYPVLKVSGKLEVGKWEVGGSKEFVGSKNTKAKVHIDLGLNMGSTGAGFNPGIAAGSSCSYNFKPWDAGMEKLDEVEETTVPDPTAATFDKILPSNSIMLSESRVFLDKGKTASISVTGLPEGYKPGDLVAESDDEQIAKLDVKEGIITAGNKSGTAQIVVRTSDGKYKAFLAVTVNDDQTPGFQGISGGGAGGGGGSRW